MPALSNKEKQAQERVRKKLDKDIHEAYLQRERNRKKYRDNCRKFVVRKIKKV